MSYETIIYEKKDQIGIITMNRPKALNAINQKVVEELEQLVGEIEQDKDLRVLIITGAGRSFVAGADIKEMYEMDVTQARAFSRWGAAVMRRIENLEIPTIAAVNGFALGGGCELSMCCDIILAAGPNAEGKGGAQFGLPEVGLGLIPGFSGTQRLPRRIGAAKAKELTFSAKNVNAAKAKEIGLVNEVYPAEELMDQAIKMANSFIKNAPISLKYAKASINRGLQTNIDDGIKTENDLFGMCFAHEDHKEGMGAFMEGRKEKNFQNK